MKDKVIKVIYIAMLLLSMVQIGVFVRHTALLKSAIALIVEYSNGPGITSPTNMGDLHIVPSPTSPIFVGILEIPTYALLVILYSVVIGLQMIHAKWKVSLIERICYLVFIVLILLLLNIYMIYEYLYIISELRRPPVFLN